MPLRSILIADDEESIRHVLTVLLADRGYEVRAVKDGEEALQELASREYDALVTDVRMPRMDGLALVRAAQAAAPDTTIIVMSASMNFDSVRNLPIQDYVSKPFDLDDVVLHVRRALRTYVPVHGEKVADHMRRREEVLEVVQNQKQFPRAQIGDQRFEQRDTCNFMYPECQRNRRCDELWVGDRCQEYKRRPIHVGAAARVRGLQRQTSLTRTARAR